MLDPNVGPRAVPALAGLVLLALAAPACRGGPAADAPARAERLGGDVIAGGSSVSVTTSVPGDAILAGGRVDFSGATGGDYLGAGGDQQIGGRVGGSVRAAGGEVVLGGEVGRNAALAGGRVEVGEGASVAGNAYLAGGEIRLAGALEGGARIAGGTVSIEGPIGGDVSVNAGRLRIGPAASIGGELRYRVAPENVSIDPGAAIAGQVVALPPTGRLRGLPLLRLLWHLGFLVAGAVAIALFPRLGDSAAHTLGARTGASAALGFAWILAVPVVLLSIAVTLIGIPLALIGFGVYMASVYLGRAVFAVWLGQRLLGERARPDRWGVLLAFLAGGLIVVVAGLLPFLGPAVTLVATVLGLGAAVAALTRPGPAPA